MAHVSCMPHLIPEKINQDENVSYFDQFNYDAPQNSSKSESSVNNFKEPPTESSDNLSDEYWYLLEEKEQLIVSSYIRRYFQSGDYPVRYRKSDFLYPHHYFW
jgi:hypothetical protein